MDLQQHHGDAGAMLSIEFDCIFSIGGRPHLEPMSLQTQLQEDPNEVIRICDEDADLFLRRPSLCHATCAFALLVRQFTCCWFAMWHGEISWFQVDGPTFKLLQASCIPETAAAAA
jgi:hypothetical protein